MPGALLRLLWLLGERSLACQPKDKAGLNHHVIKLTPCRVFSGRQKWLLNGLY
jgi:hypothetical protein